MKKALLFLSVSISLCLLCSCGNSGDTSSVKVDETKALAADPVNVGYEEQANNNNNAYKITCYSSSDSNTGDSDVWTVDDEQFCIDFVSWAESIPDNFDLKEKPEPNGQTAVGGYSLEVQYRDENGELHNLEQTKDPTANIKLDGEYYHISAGDLDMFSALYDYQ